MTKGTGLGARLYTGGYDISGDTQTVAISAAMAPLDVTDITQSAHSRIPGLRDGSMDITVYFDKTGAHVPLSALPTADEVMTFLAPPAGVGAPAACLNARQIGYDPARGADGSLTLKTQGTADGYGLEWCAALTSGTRTDTGAADGASWNNGAAGLYGAQAYLNALALTGTDVTVTVQQSADDSTWITLAAFTEIVSGNLPPLSQRIATFSGAFTATDASPAVFTAAGSAFADGTPVTLAGTSLPGGFSAGTVYYVVSASTDTFELAATSGGSAIDSTTTGSGTVYQAVLQYLRAVTTTSGGFTSFAFVAAVNVNPVPTAF